MATEQDLRAVLELSERATPGEWKETHSGTDNLSIMAGEKYVVGGCGCCGSPYGDNLDTDAPLLAAAVNLLRTHGPALLRAVEDARRYRFLRDDAHTNRVPHIYQYPAQSFDKTEFPHFRDVGLDAAIDAAIAEGEG